MYDLLYRQMLFSSAVLGFLCLFTLVAAVWWLRQSLARVRAGHGGKAPLVVAGVMAAATLLALLGLALFAVVGAPRLIDILERQQEAEREVAALVDQPAPHLHFATVADDRAYHLEEFQGDVVLVNFWATWCGPCRQEMPDLERLQRDLGERGLRVIHLSREPRGVLSSYLDEERPTNLHVYAEATQWPAFALPTTYVVDRDGMLRGYRIGRSDYSEFAEMVGPYL